MAKKNNNNGVENKNKNNDGGEKKKAIASKIVKWVKSFQGAESVKSEGQANKLTVVGKVDPTKLRDELATKTKNKVDLVSSKPKKDNKVNKDDANDTKKKKPEKTDNDEKPKEAPLKSRNLRVLNRRHLRVLRVLNRRHLRVLNRTNLLLTLTHSRNLTLSEYLSKKTEGYNPVRVALESAAEYISCLKIQTQAMSELSEMLKMPMKIAPPKEKNGGNDNNDDNDDNDGGGGGDEKKKEEDEGNGGGKMKYPAGQSGFGQFSYGKVYRHGYGYQNGALKTGEEKMLLLCCEVLAY